MGFGIVPAAAHSESFVEIYAEHAVGDLEAVDAIQVGI
jgi:hypothetical protein